MTRPVVRCRCGHRVLAKEVLRTDLYERPSGREYVYVKYRCKRCKRLGETFVAESRWDWHIFETTRTEMSEAESENFEGQAPISVEEVLAFHRQLTEIEAAGDLKGNFSDDAIPSISPEPKVPEAGPSKPRPEARRELKGEGKNDQKSRPRETGSRDESPHHNHPPREG
jgi:DNA-directed RNA polymerase subunit RPC12/RpoP